MTAMVGPEGFEPSTTRLSVECSYQAELRALVEGRLLLRDLYFFAQIKFKSPLAILPLRRAGRLAADHLPRTQGVVGSNPTQSTRNFPTKILSIEATFTLKVPHSPRRVSGKLQFAEQLMVPQRLSQPLKADRCLSTT